MIQFPSGGALRDSSFVGMTGAVDGMTAGRAKRPEKNTHKGCSTGSGLSRIAERRGRRVPDGGRIVGERRQPQGLQYG
jgi:hypothetical protein